MRRTALWYLALLTLTLPLTLPFDALSGSLVLKDSVSRHNSTTESAVKIGRDSAAGNIFVTGTTTATGGNKQINLLKLSRTLVYVSDTSIGNNTSGLNDFPTDLTVTPTGDVYLSGYGYDPGTYQKGYVFKFNSSLQKQWGNYFDSTNTYVKRVIDHVVTSNGIYYAVSAQGAPPLSLPRYFGSTARYPLAGTTPTWIDSIISVSNGDSISKFYCQGITAGNGSVYSATVGYTQAQGWQLYMKRFDDNSTKSVKASSNYSLEVGQDTIQDIIYVPGASAAANARILVATKFRLFCFDTTLTRKWYDTVNYSSLAVVAPDTILAAGDDGVAKYAVAGTTPVIRFSENDSYTNSSIAVDAAGNSLVLGSDGNKMILRWFHRNVGLYFCDSLVYDPANSDVGADVVACNTDTFYVLGTNGGNNFHVASFYHAPSPCAVYCSSKNYCAGDVNNDGSVDIVDVTDLTDHLFISFAPYASPIDRGDLDGDVGCNIDLSDLTALVNYVFITFVPPICSDCP